MPKAELVGHASVTPWPLLAAFSAAAVFGCGCATCAIPWSWISAHLDAINYYYHRVYYRPALLSGLDFVFFCRVPGEARFNALHG
jgi:hypothetical protein